MKRKAAVLCALTAVMLCSCSELGESSNRIASLSAPVTGITTTLRTSPTTVSSAVTVTGEITTFKTAAKCRKINFDGGYVLFANKDGTYTLMNKDKDAVQSLTLTDDNGDKITITLSKEGIGCKVGDKEVNEFLYKGNVIAIKNGVVYFAGTKVEYYDTSFSKFTIYDDVVIECVGKNKFIIKEDGKDIDKTVIKDDNGNSYSLEKRDKGIWIVNSADELMLSVVIGGKYIDVANDHIIVNGQTLVPPGSDDIATKTTTTTTTTAEKKEDKEDSEAETTSTTTKQTTVVTYIVYEELPQEEYEPEPEQPVVTESPMANNKNVNISSETAELLGLVNEVRRQHGLNELYGLELLDQAASIRAAEQVDSYFRTENLSHSRPDGQGCETVIEEVGLPDWTAFAENLAYGMNANSTVKDVFNSWMNSEGHRNNILNPDVKYMGVARYEVSKDGNTYYFWSQFFYNDTF